MHEGDEEGGAERHERHRVNVLDLKYLLKMYFCSKYGKQQQLNSIHLWIIDDRGDNEEDGEDQDYEGNRYGDLKYFNTKHQVRQKKLLLYLVRPCDLRLLPPECDEGRHGHPVEDPDCKGEEVDEALDVSLQDHEVGDEGVEEEGGGGRQVVLVHEGEDVQQVALAARHKAESKREDSKSIFLFGFSAVNVFSFYCIPPGGKDSSVGGSEGGDGHGERHDPGKDTKHAVAESLRKIFQERYSTMDFL